MTVLKRFLADHKWYRSHIPRSMVPGCLLMAISPVILLFAILSWEGGYWLFFVTSALLLLAILYFILWDTHSPLKLGTRFNLRLPDGFDAWMAELQGFAQRDELEARTHPELLALWERCARAVDDITTNLDSDYWRKKSALKEYRDARRHAQVLSVDVFTDSLWSGRRLCRPLRGRKQAFAENVADPAWGQDVLEVIRQSADELERLAELVRPPDAVDMTGHPNLDAAFQRLEEIHAAETELERDAPSVQLSDE